MKNVAFTRNDYFGVCLVSRKMLEKGSIFENFELFAYFLWHLFSWRGNVKKKKEKEKRTAEENVLVTI